MKKTFLIILFLSLFVGFIGCKEKGPAEKAGQKIDETMEKAGEKAKELMEK